MFALYIAEMGIGIDAAKVGFNFGGVIFSGLLFADDIVLTATTFQDLENLIQLVKGHCDSLMLTISSSKSNIVTPDDVDQMLLLDDDDNVTLALSKVLSYKYLGTETTLLMSSTGSKHQQKCIQIAKRYKYSCCYLGRIGPDFVDTVLATWSNIAISSILSGCEVIQFTESNINIIERIQSQVAKIALSVPQNTSNVCAQTEMGMKPFRMRLYELQLSYYTRLLNLSRDRWVHKVLYDHLTGGWHSPYMAYIFRIRGELQLVGAPPSKKFLSINLNCNFLNKTNRTISTQSLPNLMPVTSFARKSYVCEGYDSSMIALMKLSNAGLGNRAPRIGRSRATTCTLCHQILNEAHVAFSCSFLEEFRQQHTDISAFKSMCKRRGIYPTLAFKWYVNGLHWDGSQVTTTVYKNRGRALAKVRDNWLQLTQ